MTVDKSLLIGIITTNFAFFVHVLWKFISNMSMIPKMRIDLDGAWTEIRVLQDKIKYLQGIKNEKPS